MPKLLVLSAAFAITAATCMVASEPATATGKVTNSDGKPVDHATVLVYSARVRKGYSIFCPTCWVDCGKRTVTDAGGSYSITGLNPGLVFKLLVVKDGYVPGFVEKMDPANGPAPDASLKTRAPVADASQIVRGRVVDSQGDPVKGALIEQEGIILKNGRSFGDDGWIDLVAATNDEGQFEIAYGKPAAAMVLNVDARAMARKLFTESTGPDLKIMMVSRGATVRGRLIGPDGKPVTDAEIGIMTHSRFSGSAFPETRIGVKDDGTFEITNVPAGRIWYVYPKMASLASRGLAGAAVLLETKDDGEQVNVGDIQLRPAYTLRGKVVLSDGKPIPPDMHVTLGADEGVDSQLVNIAPNGSFEFRGLRQGAYGVSPAVKGYASPEGTVGEVLMNADRDDVTFRLDPSPSKQ